MAAFFGFLKPAAVYSIILKGTVVMPDGSPLAFTAGIERICSDNAGSAPGPTTNKKGEYLWRVVRPSGDPSLLPRRYVSWLHFHYCRDLEPRYHSHDYHLAAAGAEPICQAAVGSPEFAQGWHALGVVDERLQRPSAARQAYKRAMEAEPKLLSPYVMLARLCVKMKDWQCATKTADALIKVDHKRTYPEICLHRAVAVYGLKDLEGALAGVEERPQARSAT